MNRLTYTIPKDHLTSAQHRKETESTPEHIVFSGKTAGGDTVTYRMDPEDFYRHADHLLAARVEELLTVNENEVNGALASVDDARREIGTQLSAIRAGIRRRFRTSTGTPAIEEFGERETLPLRAYAPGEEGDCVVCGDGVINEHARPVPAEKFTCFTCMNIPEPDGAPEPSDEAIEDGDAGA